MDDSDDKGLRACPLDTDVGEDISSELEDVTQNRYELLPVSAPWPSQPGVLMRPRGRRWLGWSSAFVLGVVVSAMAGLLFSHEPRTVVSSQTPNAAVSVNSAAAVPTPGMNQIEVDVHGDVLHPGVYALPANARVMDAIRAAGGYLHAVDADNVNAAAPLNDGAEVEILPPTGTRGAATSNLTLPAVGSNSVSGSIASPPESSQGGANRVDLNTADATTLETLPDIGPARAQAIVAYRTEHGPFVSVSGVTAVSGIGPGVLSRISPYLFVNHSTS